MIAYQAQQLDLNNNTRYAPEVLKGTDDQVGSLKAVADSAGNVVKKINYDSFGNIIADTDPLFDMPFGFAGGLHDRDTGLVRFGYRDYDPDTGRWTAKDPILFAGRDTDLFQYVLNDPINLIDPLGLFAPFGGPGFTNLMPNKPPSWSEQSNNYPSPVPGLGEGVNMHNAIPGQFAVLGPDAVIKTSSIISRGLVSPISNLIKYGTPPILLPDPEMLENIFSPKPAEASVCP